MKPKTKLVCALISTTMLMGCSTAVRNDEFARVTIASTIAPAAPTPTKQPTCTDADRAANPDVASYPPITDVVVTPKSTLFRLGGVDPERIIAGVSADTLLFGFRNPLTGRLEGLDVDIIREVAKALFNVTDAEVDSKIEFRVIQYKDRLPLLESNSIDVVAHTMTINCDRWKRIAFSSQYYSAGQKLLVRSDSTAKDMGSLTTGTRMCLPAGGTSTETIARFKNISPKDVVEVGDITECLVKLQQGQVDATLSDDTVLAGFIRQDPYLKMVGEPITEEPYGLGVNAENITLAQFINQVLETLRTNGGLQKLYDKHSLTDAKVPPADHSRVPNTP